LKKNIFLLVFLALTACTPATTSPSQPSNANTPTPSTPATTSPSSIYLNSYDLEDKEFGTSVKVTVNNTTRTLISNALPNHKTGAFPNNGNPNTISPQNVTYSYSLNPTYVGLAIEVRTTGVAVNGVKFEPGTAETTTCSSGEILRIEGLQDTYNLGMDFNNAHVQPTGEYHYHGISELMINSYASADDLVHIGFAADGFLIYYSKSGAHTSGYSLSKEFRIGNDCTLLFGPGGGRDIIINGTTPDGTYTSDWIYTQSSGNLDSCNGTTINGQYLYLITDSFPYISRCLNGKIPAELSRRPRGRTNNRPPPPKS
jgi:hypothetical protein